VQLSPRYLFHIRTSLARSQRPLHDMTRHTAHISFRIRPQTRRTSKEVQDCLTTTFIAHHLDAYSGVSLEDQRRSFAPFHPALVERHLSSLQSILVIVCRGGDSNDVTPMLPGNMVSCKRHLRRCVSESAPHVGVSGPASRDRHRSG
jgi:hypothetical protein